jgi:general secretion pathway protein I
MITRRSIRPTTKLARHAEDCRIRDLQRLQRCGSLAVRRRGLSLLEVILAIAILGGCIAVIGELIRIGSRQAEEAREMTIAQLLCESKLNEIASGILPPESVSGAPCETDVDWMYSVGITPLDGSSLIEVRVTVEQAQSTRLIPLSFTLVRWMIDPLAEEIEFGADMGATSSTSTSSSSAGSSSSGSGNTRSGSSLGASNG